MGAQMMAPPTGTMAAQQIPAHKQQQHFFVPLMGVRAPKPDTDIQHECPEDRIKDEEVDGETRKMMAKHGNKPCPHCGVMTTKVSGCNFMTCSRCKKNWCWQTGKKRYGPDGCGGGHGC